MPGWLPDVSVRLAWCKGVNHRQVEGIPLELVTGGFVKFHAHFEVRRIAGSEGEVLQGRLFEVVEGDFTIAIGIPDLPVTVVVTR